MPARPGPRLALTPAAYRRITGFALGALGLIVVTGAAVRLTGSGLGCSDWPQCERDQLVAALDQPHAVIEFVNRMITGVVSVAVILAVLGSLARTPRRRDLTRWSVGLVGGVVAQIVLGGITVKVGLAPPFVMGHFLLSAVLVWNAVVLHHRAGIEDGGAEVDGDHDGSGDGGPAAAGRRALLTGRAMVVMAGIVLATGTVVTGAGPHGGDEDVRRLAVRVESVARIHGIAAMALVALVVAAVWLVARDPAIARDAVWRATMRARGGMLVAVVLAQAAVGYAQYFTGVPVVLVGLHVTGSVLVWVAVLSFHLGLATPGRGAGGRATGSRRAGHAGRGGRAERAERAGAGTTTPRDDRTQVVAR